jgi:hypothetical protein
MVTAPFVIAGSKKAKGFIGRLQWDVNFHRHYVTTITALVPALNPQ